MNVDVKSNLIERKGRDWSEAAANRLPDLSTALVSRQESGAR